ncbi:UNVERIFIED_CONTAM: hypothetical protein NCL1_07514 [Trichonephila clavipes]
MKRMKTRATNNNNESSKGPSNGDVFSVLDTAMEWYEQQSECCPIQLLLLKRIRDLVQGKNEATVMDGLSHPLVYEDLMED